MVTTQREVPTSKIPRLEFSTPMFRKTRLHVPPGSIPGEIPCENVGERHFLPLVSPSPSSKKQKLSHPTPAKSTPAKPKQSLLKPYAPIGSSGKNSLSTSPFASSQSAGKGPKKNTSILSFFKPATPAVKPGQCGKLGGTQSDELFSRHGGYDLDVSDPEENEEEEVVDSGGWATGRSINGELQLAKSNLGMEDELFASPIRIQPRNALPAGPENDMETADEGDAVDTKSEVDEIESTAPSTETTSAPDPVTPLRLVLTAGLTFNPASLNLDSSRSVLFSKGGATPSLFKKLKKARASGSPSPSTEDAGLHGVNDEELRVSIENRDIEKFPAAQTPVNGTKGMGKPERNCGEAFRRDSIESSSDTVTKEEEEKSQAQTDVPSLRIDKKSEDCSPESKPQIKKAGSAFGDNDFEDIDDYPDEEIGFEEQESHDFDPSGRAIEAGYEGVDSDFGAFEDPRGFKDIEDIEDSTPQGTNATRCPICAATIGTLSEQDANNHVNHCLDGKPIPLPTPHSKHPPTGPTTSRFFSSASIISPSLPNLTPNPHKPSAFTKLMTQNTESAAWASAAAREVSSRGKKAAERTCPFYKILFNGAITVDAFRYGAVPGCKAYFLSHFHSDHYVGLTSTWAHGPIWCSRATANLVRKKLGVDQTWVKELPWEAWTSFGVEGVRVRGLDANHCPGSMLFLFEGGRQRVLHCGDFRACPEHLTHPLLAPGKDGVRGQRIDTVYLDTTYLNPKYAFPSQKSVIEACSALCVGMNEEASQGVAPKTHKSSVGSFISAGPAAAGEKGRLLVVVGTYSIGKERVCLGIAKALDSKIFAPPNKMKICEYLEDPELNARLTSNPRDAQVHMTPLMDIRTETLQEYLNTFKPSFNRVVGLRPTGWNYRPPNSRFTESPAVNTVLLSASWRSEYSSDELVPQRGGTRESKCYGVPYSEHSSFRELTMFCCALNIGKIIPTVKYAIHTPVMR